MSREPKPALEPIGESFAFGGKPLQVYGSPEEPWFFRNEVCEILEHVNPRKSSSTLDPDEVMVSPIVTPHSGVQQATFISESGLYALIMKSRTPQAKAFRKFVTREVYAFVIPLAGG